MVADIAHGFILACDFLSSLENPLSSFVFLCGVLYLLQAGLSCLRQSGTLSLVKIYRDTAL